MSEWIPITERLPEPDIKVLVTDGIDVVIAKRETRYDSDVVLFVNTCYCSDYADYEYVTHWQPLPIFSQRAE